MFLCRSHVTLLIHFAPLLLSAVVHVTRFYSELVSCCDFDEGTVAIHTMYVTANLITDKNIIARLIMDTT